ncbi:Nn.00g023500.m01.CDS01 [Neocucurbitaria sp. VM-36]
MTLNPLPASDIGLFVTNLRLLDLDLRSDWPGITVQTFSAKNADQKQRIAGTEWALFRLFEIWDGNETAQKLQPFFPPLEPLQSLNLRAALYRCLNDLKKNGVLGRESVLRKTMLDECKGEKFYEILALFSTVVLKKILATREGNNRNAAVARRLATATTLSTENQQSLLPLAIAHKAALVNVLKRKEAKRRRFMEFERMLDAKAGDINHRIRKCKDTPRAKRSTVPQKEAEAIKKQLKDNWIGNQKWLDVMLHGDGVEAQDAFLNSRFDKVWHTVENGRKLDDVAAEIGLLENLQSRVQEQQERLLKWKSFHEEIKRQDVRTVEKVHAAPVAVKEYKFENHLKHQLPSSKHKTDLVSFQRPSMRPEYQDILADMDTELLHLSKVKPHQTSGPLSKRRTSSSSGPRSPNRSRKNTRSGSIPKEPMSPSRPPMPRRQTREKSLENIPVLPRPPNAPRVATPADSEATLIGHPSTLRSVVPDSRTAETSSEAHYNSRPGPEQTPPTSDPIVTAPSPPHSNNLPPSRPPLSPTPSLSPGVESTYPSEPPIPEFEHTELNPEEALAEEIITSIGNATPSPVKKPQPQMPLSLMERTRMSMARTTSFEPVPESPELPLPPMPPPPIVEVDMDRQTSLLERTRLSMVAMQNKPRMSISAREKKEKRKSRQSLFPVNQFDTPRTRKSIEVIEETRSIERTPKEELFSDEVDYDRVFKSRPRIATSPVFSPPQERGVGYDSADGEEYEDGDGEVTGIDLGDVDQDEDEDGFTKTWAESPSRRARGVRY